MERNFYIAGPCFSGERDKLPAFAGHLDALCLSEGGMAVFGLAPSKPRPEKHFTRDVSLDGRTLHVVGQ